MPQLLINWYRENARDLPWRHDKDPYHIWLSEIMLQQTRVETVKDYYTKFLRVCPTVKVLAQTDIEILLKLWEGLGYYSRVRNIQLAAKRIVEKYDGIFPNDYAQLLSLPGIGPYTAGAICSISFNMPIPAVDGNVLRVVMRLLCNSLPISRESTKKEVANALREIIPDEAGVFTQSLMEIGAMVCVPNGAPKCGICPLRTVCLSAQNDSWNQYPKKESKKSRREEDYTVFVLRCGEYEAVKKREGNGLLADLWEYPNIKGMLSVEEALYIVDQWGCFPENLSMQIDKKHIFTHVLWNMRCYYFSCRNMPDSFIWASKKEMDNEFALPTAFRQFRI